MLLFVKFFGFASFSGGLELPGLEEITISG